MNDVRVVPAGDAAWLIELENRLDAEVNARAIAIGRAVRASGLEGLRDVVTGYRSVAVYVDPVTAAAEAAERLTSLARDTAVAREDAGRVIDVPVCYGGGFGPDLAEVAAFAGCPADARVGIDSQRLHYQELTIKSTFHHTPQSVRKAFRLIADGLVDPNAFITGQEPLERLPSVLDRMARGADGLKTAILTWGRE